MNNSCYAVQDYFLLDYLDALDIGSQLISKSRMMLIRMPQTSKLQQTSLAFSNAFGFSSS